ncbi:MAG TPA: competence type IV pilus minor pilin ComGD [Bacillus sp. (in: firmicutes)]|nr:competence type IV pilus minor pilin ComGD [Bacillus sp. (in: firmicutes)]
MFLRQLHHQQSKNGFTLLEVLVVLAVVHAIMFVTIVKIDPLMQQYRLYWFIRQLETDVFYAQETAITRGQVISLRFTPDKHEYFILAANTPAPIFRRSYDSRIQVELATLGSQIKFLSNGNISTSGTMFVSSSSIMYRVVFLLGTGRFYAQKL